MTQIDYYTKTTEVLDKFKDANQLYYTSPTFNVCVQQLVRGLSPYEIIQNLCQREDDIMKAFTQQVLRK